MFFASPPIGLGYLATALRKIDQEVDLVDCVINHWDNQKTTDYIDETRPDVIGITMFSTALNSVKDLLGRVKKLDYSPVIILGGPHCTGVPKHTLKFFPEANYAFRGEGEISIVEFHEFLSGNREEKDVTGLVWRKGDGIIVNPPIEYKNIEEFGFPAWDLLYPPKYFNELTVGKKTINIHFTRGCPFHCRFCVKLGTKIRIRTIDHIWSEIDYLNENYGIERFIINDEGYTMFPNYVKKFCRSAIARGNKYSFFACTGMRLNRMDDEMLELMKESRHDMDFGVGIESAVPRVRQDLMNKELTQEELVKGLGLLKKHGFRPVGNFIIGFPDSTIEEDKESVRWACKAYDKGLLWGANFVPWLPLPGSEAVNTLIANGELKNFDFSKLNLSAVVYAPKGRTIKQMDRLRKWAVWKINTRPKILWWYISDWGRLKRAAVTFLRIYLPNWMLWGDWRRT